MLRTIVSAVALALLSFPLGAAPTITYEIRSLEVQPNPAPSIDGKPADVKVVVTIKPMGSMGMATDSCEAVLDFGNGTPPKQLTLGGTGVVRYEFDASYAKTGDYTLKAQGVPGLRACQSSKSAKLEVQPTTQEAANAAAAERAKVKTFVYTATAANPAKEVRQPRLVSAECPKGWSLVPGSQYGPRFTCKLQPVEPLACEPGTSYFESGNTIGCR